MLLILLGILYLYDFIVFFCLCLKRRHGRLSSLVVWLKAGHSGDFAESRDLADGNAFHP